MESLSSKKLSLKLLVDAESDRVLFAEAGKDFVDFLFSLLALPIGTVVRLLTKDGGGGGGMVGSIRNLYDSAEKLDHTFMLSARKKDLLLNPKASVSVCRSPLLLATNGAASYLPFQMPPAFFSASSSSAFPTSATGFSSRTSSSEEEGYVKGVVTYTVTDGLQVKPMSTISSITLLNHFNAKDLSSLQEKVVEIGMPQVTLSLPPSLP